MQCLAQDQPDLFLRVLLPFHDKIPPPFLQAYFVRTITSMLDQFSGCRPGQNQPRKGMTSAREVPVT